MYRAITVFSVIVSASALCAQCSVPISPTMVVVSGANADTISTLGESYWVCSDASGQVFDGSNNSYLVEAGASITVIGYFGSIYYKGSIPLVVLGYQNFMTAEDSSAFFDGGVDNIIVECGVGNVVFNYDNRPSDGCSLVGILEQPAVPLFTASPNPTDGWLQIEFTDAAAHMLEVTNALGELALTFPFQQQIDLGTLPTGTYMITVRDGRGQALARARFMRS